MPDGTQQPPPATKLCAYMRSTQVSVALHELSNTLQAMSHTLGHVPFSREENDKFQSTKVAAKRAEALRKAEEREKEYSQELKQK